MKTIFRWLGLALGLLLLWAVGLGVSSLTASKDEDGRRVPLSVWGEPWAQDLREQWAQHRYPEIIPDGGGTLSVEYTFDRELQQQMEKLLNQYSPDFGAVVALDPVTGELKAWAQHIRSKQFAPGSNWLIRRDFVAARLFKLVTSAVAIEEEGLKPETPIWFNGGSHTLYKKNVEKLQWNRWIRQASLAEAFAHSYNTPFARIALEYVDPAQLRRMAESLGYNRKIYSDLEVLLGSLQVPDEKSFNYAEIASGFNRLTKTSPLHAAMMAAAVVNDGTMMTPYWVRAIKKGEEWIYTSKPEIFSNPFSPRTAEALRVLMQNTVERGTSRKSFFSARKKFEFLSIEVGGKTGSLTNVNPQGKVDWFIGYATSPKGEKLAVSALTLNEKVWRVKSSALAKMLIERAFIDKDRSLAFWEARGRGKKKASSRSN